MKSILAEIKELERQLSAGVSNYEKLEPAIAEIVKDAAIQTGLADAPSARNKHRDAMVRYLKEKGEHEIAKMVSGWNSQELLDFRNDVGI